MNLNEEKNIESEILSVNRKDEKIFQNLPEDLRKVLAYVKKSVNLDAALPLRKVAKRWLKAEGRGTGKLNMRFYESYIKNNAKLYELYCVKDRYIKNGKITYLVMRDRTNYTSKPTFKKSFCSNILCEEAKHGETSAHKVLKEKTNLCESNRYKEIAKIRKNAYRYNLEFYKKGRVLMVRLASRSSKNTCTKEMAPSISKLKKSKKINTADCQASKNQEKDSVKRKPSRKIQNMAHFIAKEIKTTYFYDNVKVRFNYGMTYLCVLDGLMEGYGKELIKRKFSHAVERRHGDATDCGLNCGMPTYKFEMSSTVSMVRKLLRDSSTKTKNERWLDTNKAMAERESIEPRATRPRRERFHFERTKEIMKPLTDNEMLRTLGYSNRQLSLFQTFQSRPQLPPNPDYFRLFYRMEKDLADRKALVVQAQEDANISEHKKRENKNMAKRKEDYRQLNISDCPKMDYKPSYSRVLAAKSSNESMLDNEKEGIAHFNSWADEYK